MNSINSHSIAGRSLGLFLAMILATSAYAGPGLQYWQSLGKPAAAKSEIAKVCTGSQIVATTVMKPILSNGRGPLHEVQIGTSQVCNTCATVATVMKPSLPNGRGPLQPATVANSQHDCGSSCMHATHA